MNTRIIASIFGSCSLVILFTSNASAQVQRTFVSGLGSDSNPCSRTAPCRTFAQAISQTNAAGEVYVLDSAGYGAFAINKSISIVAPQGVTAGISVFFGDGIDINAGSNDAVILRGLTVNNQGSTGSGILFSAGGLLHLESCIISGFSSNFGLQFFGPGRLEVKDSTMRGNAIGIFVSSAGQTAARAVIDQVRLALNTTAGLEAQDGARVTIRNSIASGGNVGFLGSTFNNNAFSFVHIENCVASHNGSGVKVDNQAMMGGGPIIRISNSMVTSNGTGLENANTGIIFSRGNNTIEDNSLNFLGSTSTYSAK